MVIAYEQYVNSLEIYIWASSELFNFRSLYRENTEMQQ